MKSAWLLSMLMMAVSAGPAWVQEREEEPAWKTNPTSASDYFRRGYAYKKLKQYQRAIEDYNKAIELEPEYALAYNNRGIAYGYLGQYQRAIEDYTKESWLNNIPLCLSRRNRPIVPWG